MMDHLHVEKADFVGCSIGGYLLLELWRRAPERMMKLAFVCSKAQGRHSRGSREAQADYSSD